MPPPALHRRRSFVDAASSGETLATLNPHDNSVHRPGRAWPARADVDRAVAAARAGLPGLEPAWRRPIAAASCCRLADLIEANAEELARLESLDTGHPLRDSRMLDVPRTAACFRYFGGMADKFQGETIPVEAGFLNYTLREPVGVVGPGRAVELPADVHQLEDGAGAGRRQLHRA